MSTGAAYCHLRATDGEPSIFILSHLSMPLKVLQKTLKPAPVNELQPVAPGGILQFGWLKGIYVVHGR